MRQLGTKYLEAYHERDWKTLCSTLTEGARARLARKAGSCPAAYKDSPKVPKRVAKGEAVMDVKVNGDRATLTIGNYYGDVQPQPKMYAAKVDGEWLLYIKRAAKGAK